MMLILHSCNYLGWDEFVLKALAYYIMTENCCNMGAEPQLKNSVFILEDDLAFASLEVLTCNSWCDFFFPSQLCHVPNLNPRISLGLVVVELQ